MKIPKPNISRFNPPVYCCRKANEKHVLDGRLDKSFWNNAPFSAPFVDIEGEHKGKPKYQTRVKMLWDENNLYIGAELEGDEIWATLKERDSVIFWDNDFEVFINPACDTHAYYEIEMNALNTVWDLLLTKPYLNGGYAVDAFDLTGMRTAVYIDGKLNDPLADNRKWSVELALPLKTLMQCNDKHKRIPDIGDYWRINFSRVQWDVDVCENRYVKRINPETNAPYPEHNWVFAPTGLVNIHYPDLWGFLFFAQAEETYKIPDVEYARWALRTLYYNAHAFHARNGFFTDAFSSISDGYDYPETPIIQTTKHGFEVSVRTSEGEEVYLFADGRSVVVQT